MDDFLTYLQNHPVKRRITGIVTLTPVDPPPEGADACFCELAKRPLIEWLIKNHGKIHDRLPGNLQLKLNGPYEEFWKKLIVKKFPSMTLSFSTPSKK
jgi:hypothetical protein